MSEQAHPLADGYLLDLVFEQAGEIRGLSEDCDTERERADRFDEGICAVQWTFSRLPHASCVAVPVPVVLTMMRDVVRYGQTGARAEWIGVALEEVGR